MPKGKAPGPDDVPAEILQAMPPAFHTTLLLLYQCMARDGYTPEQWMTSHTCLIYKKSDPTILDNYRPIALTNVIYKLWTTIIADIASNFAEAHKIFSPTAEGFRKRRSGTRASMLLQLVIEHAHRTKTDAYIHYIDFKGAFPSLDHRLLTRTLTFLGFPKDFTSLVRNLYTSATTVFLTPHGPTPPIKI
jgi:hypothetical protein